MTRDLSRRGVMLGAGAAALLPSSLRAHSPLKPQPAVPQDATLVDDPRIADWVSRVSQDRLRRNVEALSALPTRWTESPDFGTVEDFTADLMEAHLAPGGPLQRQAYSLPSGDTRHNIVAGAPLTGRGLILIGAHFDSISESPATRAPGANDNASGVAAMLEVMQLLSGEDLSRDLVFVAFSGEEQGLLGSTACAALALQEGWPIDLMINLDMLGHRPTDPAARFVVEYDRGNALPVNDAAAASYGRMAVALAATHTTLPVTETDIWGSDYMPFERSGFPCIGFYDGGSEGTLYHTTGDLADAMDFDRLHQAARLIVATVATAALS